MKTALWQHQKDAVAFSKTRQGVLVGHEMGCISGDAVIVTNRGGVTRRLALRDAYRKFASSKHWFCRALKGDRFGQHRIVDIVDKGTRETCVVTLVDGRQLRCTPDHEIMTTGGWLAAADLDHEVLLLMNGVEAEACGSCGAVVVLVPEPIRVLSVEPAPPTDVYDVVMEDPHRNFVANGFVVHNCGKSATAIAICEQEKATRVLVMCPLSVVGVWPAQVERHSSMSYRVVRLDKGSVVQKTQLARSMMNSAQPTIVVINHESAWREPFRTLALSTKWDVVILDEAHRAKAPGGKLSMFLSQLTKKGTAVRVALTGTPMPHSPLDIYGIARFVDPTVFGTSNAVFRSRYAMMGGFQNHEVIGYQNMDELEKKLATIMHRVKKEDVLDLPPEVDETRYCTLEPAAMKVYRDLKKQFVAGVGEGLITASNALVTLLRLQQITGGTAKLEDGSEAVISDAKAKLLTEVIDDLAPTPEKPVIVFCRFKADLRVVEEVAGCLTGSGRYGELSGSRKDGLAADATLAPGVRVLGANIASGGVGVDLSRASTSIYYSMGFSLAELLQARARTHRPGQKFTTTHIALVAQDTVDEVIVKALETRRDLVESVLEECRKRQEGR